MNCFRAALVTDFGSVTDYSEICTDNFFDGENGLDGLLNLFEEVVDSFPTSDSRYTEYMLLFARLGEILAKRILNFTKVRIYLQALSSKLD